MDDYPSHLSCSLGQRNFFTLVETSLTGMVLVDRDGRVLYANPAAERLFGQFQGALTGSSFGFPLVAKETTEIMIPRLGEMATAEMQVAEILWGGEQAYLVSLYDITARINAENQIHQINANLERRVAERTAELEESEAFVQDVLDSIPNQIAVINQDGTILTVNEAWRRFSSENSQIPGQITPHTDVGTCYFSVCNSDSIADSEGVMDACEGIRAVIEGRLPRFNLEYPCHAPAEERWFVMTSTPLFKSKKGVVIVHSNITDRKNVEEKIRNMAYFDSLTQLPNRRMLEDRLSKALASSNRTLLFGAAMMLDLDNFKPLNDVYGHAAGDLLLIEVSRRIRDHVREVDTVARVGGDEFVIILENLDQEEDISRDKSLFVSHKILLELSKPYHLALNGENSEKFVDHNCTASIGIKLFLGNRISQNEILKHADAAMYQAKNSGRNSIKVFSDLELSICTNGSI